MTDRTAFSIGVAAGIGPAAIAALAPVVERAGFHALWVNDTPGADALAALAAAAETTDRLVLATGVLPMDRRPLAEVVAAVGALPRDRTVIGVGAGAARVGGLALVRAAVAGLHEESGIPVLVGALGPRMRALGAVAGDGVLLSWLTPALAARQAQEARAAASDAGRPASPRVALYVRTATDPAARARLDAEAARYAGYPAYAANLAREGVAVADTVLAGGRISAGAAAYAAAVDEVVLRAIVPDDDHVRFVEEAAALVG